MYNAIRISLDGKQRSYLELLKSRILTIKTRLIKNKASLKKFINPKKLKLTQ